MNKMIFALMISIMPTMASAAGSAMSVDPSVETYVPATDQLSGGIRVVGTGKETVTELMAGWCPQFQKAHPKVTCSYKPESAEKAMNSLADHKADIAVHTRLPDARELNIFTAKAGYPPLSVTIALSSYDADKRSTPIGIYVNEENPLSKLTVTQLDAIFSNDRLRGGAAITKWGQLGLTGEWAEKEIHPYGAGANEQGGVARQFRELVTNDGALRREVASLFDVYIVTRIIGVDKYGIGFTYFSGADPHSNTKRVAIAGKENGHFSDGSFMEVGAGKYPLTRTTNVYANRAPDKPLEPIVSEFIRMILSKQGQQVIAEREIFPLPPYLLPAERTKLK